jgi:DNA-nicking Smr family endonuclease
MDPDAHTSDEDSALFRRAVGPVIPMRPDLVPMERPRPAAIPLQARQETRRVLQESLSGGPELDEIETGEELLYAAPGVRPEVLRRLRRGQLSMQDRLDLHGMTVPEAKEAVARFLYACRGRGLRSVLIIHGKGLGSLQKRPVLKGKLNMWLARRAEVLAFCSARAVDGGTGAVYVLLRR